MNQGDIETFGDSNSGGEEDIAAQIEEWQRVEAQLREIYDRAENDPVAARKIMKAEANFFERMGGRQAVMARLSELRNVVARMQDQLMRQQMAEQEERR